MPLPLCALRFPPLFDTLFRGLLFFPEIILAILSTRAMATYYPCTLPHRGHLDGFS
uniref:Macaca fascicularis brain cDNA clone: QorA-11932, similar to human muscle RAS oncogene homolog (MRAS), mRNA, RefSeq: NM_012219.2 n=1 Tax=Macaca fascicularis TaxID=9541 RepID=I7G9I7_MACFA|nr:unnamed protein product [Macaca fascicularis]